jgi:hypothetical protein
MSKDEAKEFQVSNADVDSALTYVDLNVAVRFLVRSKSWSSKAQPAPGLALVPDLGGGAPTSAATSSSAIPSAAADVALAAPRAALALDVKVKENKKSVRPLTLPSRMLRPDGLATEFGRQAWRPAQTPTALLTEIRALKSKEEDAAERQADLTVT